MLDRAIVLSGFAVRRMVEKRLVTDRLAVRAFTKSGVDGFRAPFHSDTGVYPLRENYNLEKESAVHLSFMELANQAWRTSEGSGIKIVRRTGCGLK
jgi:hypothetical protein